MAKLTKLTCEIILQTCEYCGVIDLVLKKVLGADVDYFGFFNAPII